MFVTRSGFYCLAATVIVCHLSPVTAVGQVIAGIDTWQDDESATQCTLIQAANAQLVVLTANDQLALVAGADTPLAGTFIDVNDVVSFNGEPAGIVRFDTDGDGQRRVFWETLNGTLVSVDGLTGAPSDSNVLPTDLTDVRCDACEFLDDEPDCPDPEPVETTITRQPVGGNACVDDQVTLLVEASGENIESYQWLKNNVVIPGASGQVLTLESVDVFDTAAYHVNVIDEDGSGLSSDVAIVVVNPDCQTDTTPGLDLCGPGVAMMTLLTMVGLIGGRSALRGPYRRTMM